MKATNVTGRVHKKWSIRDCDDNDGWKVKDVRRRQVKAESLDGVEIMREIHSTNFDNKFDDRYWRVGNIYTIENDKLQSKFEDYKKELLELGRPPDSIKESFVFSAEAEKACKDICQEGYKVSSKKRHILGHTGSGVHLVRHYDILNRYLMFQQYTSPSHIIVYKTFLGKTKPIVPRLHKDDSYVPPYVGFDSHVSARHVEKEMPICEALNCSYVYLYEFDPIASNPVKYPRQILPYVIIQLEKKVPCIIENPFLAVGSDEARSSWEVKGETRRGFRFMFTKSGLKGKHKSFSKGFNRANSLKGQILEMRTKSAGPASEAKPPLLQKIDDSSGNKKTGQVDTRKPPDLQRFTCVPPQSTSNTNSFVLSKEIENLVIQRDVREIKQLFKYKPCVRLKRLDPKYSGSSKFRCKISNENKIPSSTDTEYTFLNHKLVPKSKLNSDSKRSCSKREQCKGKTVQDITTDFNLANDFESKESESTSRSTGILRNDDKILKELKAKESSSKERSDMTGSMDNTENASSVTPSDDNNGEKETCEENISSEVLFPNKIVTGDCFKASHRKTDKSNKKILKTEKDKPSVLKDTLLDKTLKPNLNDMSVPVCDRLTNKSTRFSSKPCIGQSKRKHRSDVMTCLDKQNLLEGGTSRGKHSKLRVKFKETTKKTHKRQRKTDTKTKLYKTKQSISLNMNGDDKDISEKVQGAQSHSFHKSVDASKTSSTIVQLNERQSDNSTEKTSANNSMKYVTESTHRKENRPEDVFEKERKSKTPSSRCAPTKTKFGMVTYKIDKSKAKTGKYTTIKHTNGDKSKYLEKEKSSIETTAVDYDFHVSNKFQNQANDLLTIKRTVDAKPCSDKSDKLNDNEHLSTKYDIRYSFNEQTKLGDGNTKLNDMFANGGTSTVKLPCSSDGKRWKPEMTESTHGNEMPSQTHSRSFGLEKSKSPVVANAAPDILNQNPVLISAQTCSSSDRTESLQNESTNTKFQFIYEQKSKEYGKSKSLDKTKIFFSEMSTYLQNEDKVQSLALIGKYPQPFTRTHVVNPVIRVDPHPEKNVTSYKESKLPTNTKKSTEQSTKQQKDQTRTNLTQSDTSDLKYQNTAEIDNKRKQTDVSHVRKNGITKDTHTSEPLPKQNDSDKHTIKAVLASPPQSQLKKIKKSSNESTVSSKHKKEDHSKETVSHKRPKIKEGHATLSTRAKLPKEPDKTVKEKDLKSRDSPMTSVHIFSKLDSAKKSNQLLETKFYVSTSHNSLPGMIEQVMDTEINVSNRKLKDTEKGDQSIKTSDEKEIAHSKAKHSSSVKIKDPQKFTESNQSLEIPVSSSNVAIKTFLADKFRSFLSSTAAVAIQHKKSTDQKNDTESKITYKQIQSTEIPEQNTDIKSMESTNAVTGTSADTCIQPVEKEMHLNNSPSLDHQNKLKEFSVTKKLEIKQKTNDSQSQSSKNTVNNSSAKIPSIPSKTITLETLLKAPLKEPKVMNLKRTSRGFSAEMHDNDSQETIIGGMENLPLQHINDESSFYKKSNEKSFDEPLTTSASDITCSIKQEKEDEGYQNETHSERHCSVLKEADTTNSDCHLSSKSLNEETQQDKVPFKEIKQEPADPNSDNTLACTSFVNTDTHCVKTEPCAPTCFFPNTRRELAKGTAMLNATDCRTAIIDTLKELSSVLKYLTESNSQNQGNIETFGSVEKKIQSMISAESTPAQRQNESNQTTDFEATDIVEQEVNMKTEPVDTDSSKRIDNTFQNKNENVALTNKLCHSEEKQDNHSSDDWPSNDNEIKYEYILKSDDDEFSKSCDGLVERSPGKVQIKPSLHTNVQMSSCSIQSKEGISHVNSLQDQTRGSSSTKAIQIQSERDELPRLFDPNNEPDISSLEDFGILKEARVRNSVTRKPVSGSNSSTDDATIIEPHTNEPLKVIKTETERESEGKLKQKQSLSFKTGVLNKGLRDRKNMFDLKTNVSRRKLFVNQKNIDRNLSVTDTSRTTKMNSIQDKLIKNTETKDLTKEGNPHFVRHHEKTDSFENEVYKSVCEKLSTLKGHTLEPKNGLESCSNKQQCEPLCTSDPLTLNEGTQPQPKPSDINVGKEQPMEKSKNDTEKFKFANRKEVPVIPFDTVIKLKKEQFWRYKRGETNKKFIDYNEIIPKMARKPDESSGKTLEENKDISMSDPQNCNTSISSTNKDLGQQLNYFIPQCKTSEISQRGTADIEDNKRKEPLQETNNRKRSLPSTDENIKTKLIKLSSDGIERNENEPNRSRSRSSHRSSPSQKRTEERSSHSEKSASFSQRHKYGDYSNLRSRLYNKYNQNFKPFTTRRPHFYGRTYSTRPHWSSHQNHRVAGKSTFSKNGTGYFSWRRKYQPRKNVSDGLVAEDKGLDKKSEYYEWNRFKNRETLRDQIENAIKEYRRTFENTPDDMKGDEKVASYLSYLTEKLDTIQSKRDKISKERIQEYYRKQKERSSSSEKRPSSRAPHTHNHYDRPLYRKYEKSKHFHDHEKKERSPLTRFSGTLASDGDPPTYKQRRHASGIEALLKEHISKHCEHLTKQIKQEMEDLKKTKIQSLEHDPEDILHPSALHRKESAYKMKTDDDEYRRPFHDRHDSYRTSTTGKTAYRGHYNKTYQSNRGSPYHKYNYNSHKNSGKDWCNFERTGRGGRYGQRYSYENETVGRHDSFRKYNNTPYYEKYNRDYYPKPHYYSQHEHFNEGKSKDKSAKTRYDRNPDRNEDFRRTYDYQQNFDKYQQNLRHENDRDVDTREGAFVRNKRVNLKPFQSNHWFRGKYNRYFNKSCTDSKKPENPIEKDTEEAEAVSVPDEFDAAQYRQFLPALEGYNRRGRGFFRGFNKNMPIYKRHFQPPMRVKNPTTYIYYNDEPADNEKKAGNDSLKLEPQDDVISNKNSIPT